MLRYVTIHNVTLRYAELRYVSLCYHVSYREMMGGDTTADALQATL